MTRSCRSRAIRSLSCSTVRRSASLRREASSSAMPACAANVVTRRPASGASGIAPWPRPTVKTPRTSPGAPSGRTMAGPSGMCCLAEGATRSSWPKSSSITGSPVDSTVPKIEVSMGSTSPRPSPAPSPAACWMTRPRRSGRGPRQQPAGHLAARPQPPLLPAGLLVQPGVVHGHARGRGQRHEQRLILLVELDIALFPGQVEVAVHLVADAHRHAEEGLHRRMPGREAKRQGAGGNLREPQRARVRYQRPEQAPALGPMMDRGDLRVVQANRDEFDQPATLPNHAEGTVPGPDQGDGRLDDLLERSLQVEAAADLDDRLKQYVDPVPGGQHVPQPALQFGEQVIEP